MANTKKSPKPSKKTGVASPAPTSKATAKVTKPTSPRQKKIQSTKKVASKQSQRKKKKLISSLDDEYEDIPDTGIYDTYNNDDNNENDDIWTRVLLPFDFFKNFAELELGLNKGYDVTVRRVKSGGFRASWVRAGIW